MGHGSSWYAIRAQILDQLIVGLDLDLVVDLSGICAGDVIFDRIDSHIQLIVRPECLEPRIALQLIDDITLLLFLGSLQTG